MSQPASEPLKPTLPASPSQRLDDPSRTNMPDTPAVSEDFMKDMIYGMIVGSALGDTVGLYTEFLSKDEAHAAYPTHDFRIEPESTTPFYLDKHRSRFTPRHWTDDTDHSLLILLSYLHQHGKVDPDDFALRLRIWIEQGTRALGTLPLGLGATVASVVENPDFLRDPVGVAYTTWIDSGGQNAANGSLMRVHPLGVICVCKTLDETFEITTANSTTTHADPRCILSCLILVGLIRGLLMGEVTEEKHIDDIYRAAGKWYTSWCESQAEEVFRDDAGRAIGGRGDKAEYLNQFIQSNYRAEALCYTADDHLTFASLKLDEEGKIGYVYKALGAAIRCLRVAMQLYEEDGDYELDYGQVFKELITELVMEDGDADTNACIAGALLGAYLGYNDLPPEWKDNLKEGAWLEEMTRGLCNISRSRREQ